MRHDLDVADVIDSDNVNGVVVMVADGFVDLPTDPTKSVDADCNRHECVSFTKRLRSFPHTFTTVIELFTKGPGSKELISGSISGSNWRDNYDCVSDVFI